MFRKRTWESLINFHNVKLYPKLPCPYCGSNTLHLDLDSAQFKPLSNAAYKSYLDKVGLFDDIKKELEENVFFGLLSSIEKISEQKNYSGAQFTAFFSCELCSESVSSVGMAQLSIDGIVEKNNIKVEFFNPPIPMFKLESSTPVTINEELLKAFNYFHSDISSSGSKLRRAMEKLCNESGCTERNLNRNIQEFAKLYPQEGRWLKSLKLVGNEATHSDGVSEQDILDSFEIFEVVLDIFRRKQIEDKINKTVLLLESRYQ
ncbi:DUF4145 domain-containing protein [Photobacterium chitinilyticum]|uniref:DUF4145 domain-containing protein n=1 Tax=Photobacterium chitinilyticum TaxID=2485123 RepID=A0A444JHX7_9GAMM|nr:DUF4145 domain-containing protein [Photobacterium chitinilyticum]RWX52721.1 DUF4145 domain-containing protein [Photobacterium chitinilyticum]